MYVCVFVHNRESLSPNNINTPPPLTSHSSCYSTVPITKQERDSRDRLKKKKTEGQGDKDMERLEKQRLIRRDIEGVKREERHKIREAEKHAEDRGG